MTIKQSMRRGLTALVVILVIATPLVVQQWCAAGSKGEFTSFDRPVDPKSWWELESHLVECASISYDTMGEQRQKRCRTEGVGWVKNLLVLYPGLKSESGKQRACETGWLADDFAKSNPEWAGIRKDLLKVCSRRSP